jgi:hypothetical protein
MVSYLYLKNQIVRKEKLRGYKRALSAIKDALGAHEATIEATEWCDDGQNHLIAPDFPVRLEMIRVEFTEDNRAGVEAALRHFGLAYTEEAPPEPLRPALGEMFPAFERR